MTTIANKFTPLFAKIVAETHHNHHDMVQRKESDIFNQIRQQDTIDQYDIDHGYHNGTAKTHHGVSAEFKVIAEHNNREIRIAAEEGRTPILMKKSEHVNGPHDMIKIVGTHANGEPIVKVYQSKYCKDLIRSFDSCIEHMEKHLDDYGVGTDGTYVIPKDQFNEAMAIKNGNVEGLSPRYIEAAKERFDRIEKLSGRAFEDKMEPGVTYEEAQRENNTRVNKERKEKFEKTHADKKASIDDEFSPNFYKSVKVGLHAAGAAACVMVVMDIAKNLAKGKNIFKGDYDADDAIDLALKTSAAAGTAAISAMLIHYLETRRRHSGLIAINAAQVIAAVIPLINDYWDGKISFTELKIGISSVISGVIINLVTGIAIGAVAGAIIAAIAPAAATLGIPAFLLSVLGALIGIGIGMLLDYANEYVSSIINADVIEQTKRHEAFIDKIREEYCKNYEVIEREFEKAFNLADVSMDKSVGVNDRLKAIDELSRFYNGQRINTEFDPNATLGFLFD